MVIRGRGKGLNLGQSFWANKLGRQGKIGLGIVEKLDGHVLGYRLRAGPGKCKRKGFKKKIQN